MTPLRIAAIAALCAGFTPSPEDGAPPIVRCYFDHAVTYGLAKCDPPSTLVQAVFGACYKHEEKVRADIFAKDRGGPADNEEIAKIAISKIHELMGPRIQGWILDAQILRNPLCKAKQ